MAQRKSQNSIDNLMMAYADLSTGGKGSSFKGPALKDVKIQKSEAPSFKPSQKSRDWSSLEQSLESTFSVQQNLSQQQQPQECPVGRGLIQQLPGQGAQLTAATPASDC